jgi:hypothetical protein
MNGILERMHKEAVVACFFIIAGIVYQHTVSRGGSVSIATRLQAGPLGFNTQDGQRLFFLPPNPDWLWGPPNLLSHGYWGGCFPGEN